ncbi:MAG: UDP-glucose dehydrogenase family protein [Chloroflexota bacterium]
MDLLVVGAGYVGLTTAVGLARLGHRVAVHDVDEARVAQLASGQAPIFEPGLEDALRDGLHAGRLSFTADPTPPPGIVAAIVCVPTPVVDDGVLDGSLVEAVVARLLESLGPDTTIAIRSTLPLHGPDRLIEVTAGRSRPPVIVNPEFMREGRAMADFAAPSRIAVGYLRPTDRSAAEAFVEVYASLDAPVVVADAKSVVLTKLASNVFLGMKIAFADELARLCDAIGADVAVVADGLGLDPRIGRSFLDSGPGFGGSCLPEQAAAIAVETASRDVVAPLLSAVAVSNRAHQDEVVGSIARLLPNGLAGARVALLGLAFKAQTDDVRHSPALVIARALRARGADVVGFDPAANETALRADRDLRTAPTAAEAIEGADAVVVTTEWPEFASLDWASLARRMRADLVYDTRRRLDADAVRSAGLRYVGLGRAAVERDNRSAIAS